MCLCPDCRTDRRLELMLNIGDEIYEGHKYVILECQSCGSSVRIRKEEN